ncbi:CTP synthase [Mycoplasmopsis primatum]|uniref:CTP synthase n=1 Tax=Mycoplasmopsis primatum TaxID=55604 RepID=UPI000497B261|nr:CTP synthase [Mycoplasmopsis primatum]
MTKFIFTTGGVLSGLGKGVTSASIGNLLKSQGFKVFALKLDPYLNVDPGALSPIEHGEVYITSDGWKCDLDLGHYERFIDVDLSKESNYSSGRIYQEIFEKEKKGFYKGKTIQIVPHVTNEIISIIENCAKKHKPDFMLIEIGGTVGDIESRAHIYAMSKFASMYPDKTFFVHVAFVPYLSASKEYKSKPSQVSISSLRSFGINPNVLLLRSQGEIDNMIISKVADASFLPRETVINVPDKANIYEIPIYLKDQKLLKIIYNHFNIKKTINNQAFKPWEDFLAKYLASKNTKSKILLCGADIALEDAYLSIIHSLKIAAAHLSIDLQIDFIKPSNLGTNTIESYIKQNQYTGLILLPGIDYKDYEVMIHLAHYCANQNVSCLGILEGYQAMVLAQARSKKLFNATSEAYKSEFKNGEYLFKKLDKFKIGAYDINIKPQSLLASIYQNDLISERYHNQYELDPKYINDIIDENFHFTGFLCKTNVPQACELNNHKFYLGIEYHPEFTTRVLKSNKLFDAFLKSTIK